MGFDKNLEVSPFFSIYVPSFRRFQRGNFLGQKKTPGPLQERRRLQVRPWYLELSGRTFQGVSELKHGEFSLRIRFPPQRPKSVIWRTVSNTPAMRTAVKQGPFHWRVQSLILRDGNQCYNPYKWVICPLTRVINLHITSYHLPYPFHL